MEENKLKKFFKSGIIIFGILLLLSLLKAAGLFNFLYFQRLKYASDKDLIIFKNYIDNKIKITKTISGDTIIQSSLIQYDFKSRLNDAYKHLVLYKQNFPEIRNITLFNSLYDIVLASEIDDYIINKNLNKEWFINSAARGYYISEISYVNKYNEYLVSIIYSIKNIIDTDIGYLMVDFSLTGLFNKFDEFKNIIVILKKHNKFIFTYPLEFIVKDGEDLNKFSKVLEKDYDEDHKLIVAAGDDFFQIPTVIKIILISFFVLLILFFLYYVFERYLRIINERNKKFNNATKDIVSISKQINKKRQGIKKAGKTTEDVAGNADNAIRKRRESHRVEKNKPKIHKFKETDNTDFMVIE